MTRDIKAPAPCPGGYCLSPRIFITLLKCPFTSLALTSAPTEWNGYEHQKAFRLHVRSDLIGSSRATIMDEIVMIYVATELATRVNQGGTLDDPVFFHPKDMLRSMGQNPGGTQVRALSASISRLQNTAVVTDLAPNGLRRSSIFNIVEQFNVPPSGKRGAWEIRPASFFVDQAKNGQILKLDTGYFKLHGLARRLAGWCRAHAGGKGYETWRLPFGTAFLKSGSTDEPRKFRYALRRLIDANNVPGFHLSSETDHRGDVLVVRRLPALTDAKQPVSHAWSSGNSSLERNAARGPFRLAVDDADDHPECAPAPRLFVP
jgi:plasmid replication initiation protein